jgi:hypothetical protein
MNNFNMYWVSGLKDGRQFGWQVFAENEADANTSALNEHPTLEISQTLLHISL